MPDTLAVRSAFAQPENDGEFTGELAAYLAELGTRRAAVIFAFPPKAAGTFLRTAAIAAIDGQLMRIAHAQGGRDGQPYLPLLVGYYNGIMGDKTLVTHIHMLALPANRRFIEVFDLRPIAMMRSIPDMLASYWDMLDTDERALNDGLNCVFPENFRTLSKAHKADLLVDILGPWYANYYATWISYSKSNPGRVCMLTYGDFLKDPARTLQDALTHARVPVTRENCHVVIQMAVLQKSRFRFNCGEEGRGKDYFSTQQIARIRRMLSHYPVLGSVADKLAN